MLSRSRLAVAGVSLAVLGSAQDAVQPRPQPLNIVLVVVDDLGWMDLGCQGSSFYETPFADSLAARGMRFTNAYAACPVCSPTRASLLTGKYPARMKTTDFFGARPRANQALLPPEHIHHLPLEEETLAEAFAAAGYRTGFVGKWHLGGEGFEPERQGFAVNVAGDHKGHPRAGYFAPWNMPNLADGPDGAYLTDALGDAAAAFVRDNADRPFFLDLSFYSVHTPLQAKADLVARYEAKRAARPEDPTPTFGQEPPRKVRQVQDHAVYAAMVHSMDENLGKVLRALDDAGVAERTVVLLTSDNGGLSTSEGHPTSNLPLRAGKGWLYEGGIREPLLVVWPGVTAPGSVSDALVSSPDVYPTLLEVAGLPARPEQHVDGVSFAGVLRGGSSNPDRALYWHYPHYGNQGGAPGGAVRRGRWKWIEHFETGEGALYDLVADVGERRDLREAQPETAAALRAELAAWRARVGAGMPTPR